MRYNNFCFFQGKRFIAHGLEFGEIPSSYVCASTHEREDPQCLKKAWIKGVCTQICVGARA